MPLCARHAQLCGVVREAKVIKNRTQNRIGKGLLSHNIIIGTSFTSTRAGVDTGCELTGVVRIQGGPLRTSQRQMSFVQVKSTHPGDPSFFLHLLRERGGVTHKGRDILLIGLSVLWIGFVDNPIEANS